ITTTEVTKVTYENNTNEGGERIGFIQTNSYITYTPSNTDTHRFVGWYSDVELNNLIVDKITENTTVYGKWVEKSFYNVSFDTNGGEGDIESLLVIEDGLIVTSSLNTTKENYTLVGWSATNSITNLWNFDLDIVTEEITLYAIWEENAYYIVSFNSKGGSSIGSIKVYADAIIKTISEPSNPLRENYIFIGWYQDEELVIPWIFNTDEVNENITLFAKWEADGETFTASIYVNGILVDTIDAIFSGDLLEEYSVDYIGENPYTSWFTNPELNIPFVSSSPITSNISLYTSLVDVNTEFEALVSSLREASEITSNIDLFTSFEHIAYPNDLVVVWLSDKEEIISNEGIVTRPSDENQIVTLSYTIKYVVNGIEITLESGEIEVTVTPIDESVQQYLSDLILSVYLEGKSTDKLLEIFNGTDHDVSLSEYRLALYGNGSPTVTQNFGLTGTLKSGQYLIVYNTGVHADVKKYITDLGSKAISLTNNSVINYNGDDALALEKNISSTWTKIDIFGKIGEQSTWTGATDHLLLRKQSVIAGVTASPSTFNCSDEWLLFQITANSPVPSAILANLCTYNPYNLPLAS
ncbi:MAG: InlB B-repeat-containing protein, partial [Acholeplasmatales bacterium]|nr:InlB B-repeat-containing protein [Acholeplasmatales bacterium]